MKKTRIVWLLSAMLLSAFSYSSAQEQNAVTGKWETTLPNGPTAIFDLKADGTGLTGTVIQNAGAPAVPISEGNIDGNSISFKLLPQGKIVAFSGTINNGKIEFTRDFKPSPDGNGGGEGLFGQNGPKSVILTRQGSAAVTDAPLVTLQGTLFKSESNEPVRNAIVDLRSDSNLAGPLSSTTTDDSGKFYFGTIHPGSYRLVATRNGYVRSAISLNAGESTDVRIPLVQSGEISGLITDAGKPKANAVVVAYKPSPDCGGHELMDVSSGITNDLGEYSISALPPGHYYVADYAGSFEDQEALDEGFPLRPLVLSPGRENAAFYEERISVRAVLHRPIGSSAADEKRYATTFFPHTTDWQAATTVDVQAGAEVSKVNIDSSPVPVRRIRGNVVGAIDGAGKPVRPNLTLIDVRMNRTFDVQTDESGSFEIPVINSGVYILNARVTVPGPKVAGNGLGIGASSRSTVLTGSEHIEVRDHDINGVFVDLTPRGTPGLHLSGTLIIEGRSTPLSTGLGALSLTIRPEPYIPGSPTYSVTQANGQTASPSQFAAENSENLRASFSDLALPPGDYRVLVEPIQTKPPASIAAARQNAYTAVRNAYVKSIRLGEEDVLKDGLHLKDQPMEGLEIVISMNTGTFEGRVIGDNKEPVASATVALVQGEGSLQCVVRKSVSTDAAGMFQIQGVVPGGYRAFAWSNLVQEAWQDPQFMRDSERRGTTIHIEEGSKQTRELLLVDSKP